MNQYITEIVRIDRECQEKIAAARQAKAGASENLTKKKEELYEMFAQEYAVTVEAKKADLQIRIDAAKAETKRAYEENFKNLQETYTTKKDTLVAELVERCLNTLL